MKMSYVFMGILLASGAASAQATPVDLSTCAAISTAAARLRCYDALAKPDTITRADTSALAPGARRIGNWIGTVTTDPLTDQKGALFILDAEGATSIDDPSLIMRCVRGDLDVYVDPDMYLGDNTALSIRFGTDAPVREFWRRASDGAALFHPGNRAKLGEFIDKVAAYERLAIQVSPYNRVPLAMVFSLEGIDSVRSELFSLCPARRR